MLLRGYKMLPKKTVSEGTRFENCLLVACGTWLICVCVGIWLICVSWVYQLKSLLNIE
jgi:hypothetical protein